MKYVRLAIAGFLALGSMNLGLLASSTTVNAADSQAVWTGTAGDNQFSTAGNWESGIVPTGDVELVFNCVSRAADDYDPINLTNAATFTASIITTTNSTNAEYCKIYTIDTLAMTPTVTLNGVAGQFPWLTIDAVSGATVTSLIDNGSQAQFKSYTVTPVNLNVNTYTSASQCDQFSVKTASLTTIKSGGKIMIADRGTITVESGGTLGVNMSADVSFNNPVTFAAGSKIGEIGMCSGAGVFGEGARTITLSGNIVLNGDVTFELPSYFTVKVTGPLSGPGKFVAGPQNQAALIVESSDNTSGSPNGAIATVDRTVTEITDDKPYDTLSITGSETVVLKGVRGDTYVYEGGILKGTGRTGDLNVYGTIAPGLSPGTITVNGTFTLSPQGTYDAEILNIDNYDKIVATNVDLSGKLNAIFLPGASIKKDQKFTIIDNTGTNPVTGTFQGLAEGAQVVVGTATFSVSYVGGTGNDVVLTALSDAQAPGTPNTGFRAVLSSPVLVGLAGVAAVGSVLWLVKRRV